MDEERIWEQSRNWKHGRRFAALCHQHWFDNFKATEDRLRESRGGFKQRRKPPPPTAATISKANATKQATFIRKWKKIMSQIDWQGSTIDISEQTLASTMSIYGSMRKLVKLGVVARRKGPPSSKPGSRPVVWEWIGDRNL